MSIKRRLKFLHIGYGHIGMGSVINKPLMICGKKYIHLGDKVTIRDGARIEAVSEWNGMKYNPTLIIGSGTTIEQNLHLTFASNLVIGENCMIMANAMITDISHQYDNIGMPPMKEDVEIKETKIGDRCFIGKNACIMPGVTLGKDVVVGANAVVTKDVPDYCVVVGIPAKVIKIRGKNETDRMD